jgi:parvulin-like peptidyl-prolyl isomerase
MKKDKGLAIPVIAIVAAIVGGSVGLAYALHLGPWRQSSPPTTVDLGPVIVTVNGAPVHLQEAKARVQGLETVHGEPQDDWQEMVLQSLIADALVEAHARELGIGVTPEALQEHIDRIRARFASDDEFEDWLSSLGMTLAELERRLALQDLTVLVYEAVTADVEVTLEDVRAYYNENRDSFVDAEGNRTPFLAVRHDIKEQLLNAEKEAAYSAWLEEERSQAEVEIVMDDWWRNVT